MYVPECACCSDEFRPDHIRVSTRFSAGHTRSVILVNRARGHARSGCLDHAKASEEQESQAQPHEHPDRHRDRYGGGDSQSDAKSHTCAAAGPDREDIQRAR
jgi:hypothetical protein